MFLIVPKHFLPFLDQGQIDVACSEKMSLFVSKILNMQPGFLMYRCTGAIQRLTFADNHYG
jgi:hypothetical protein